MAMRIKLLPVVLCTALLSGCASGVTRVDTVQSEEPAAENRSETTESSAYAESGEISKLVEKSSDKSFYANWEEITLSDNEWTELLSMFSKLQTSETILPKEMGVRNDTLTISINGATHTITRISGEISSYISVDGKAEYAVTAEAGEMFERYCGENAHELTETTGESKPASPEDRLVGLSIKCEEPKNPDEYLDTARKIVAQWLDSLKDEEERYRLPSYTFTDSLADNRVFHGDGYINGGREFVCYVGFDTPIEDEDSAFYAVGTYDTFYHYYFGPGVLARFRWENGVCTLTDYDEAFAMLTSDKLKSGLYGISSKETKYKTFYDFMNDRENVDKWLAKEVFRDSLCRYMVSHNVMMLANGRVIFMDIGNTDEPEYSGGFATAEFATTDMHQSFYDSEGESLYGSPVDYIDGSGAVVMTYRVGFPIVFDDYNHDGNPDYAIRISSDDKGSVYDVRCMDINGTPWEDNEEVYIYGEFAESIRLQVSDSGGILKPVPDENGGVRYEETKLFADKSNTMHHDVSDDELTDYRMYSQRFYLPDNLRLYDPSDGEVICYFWNNTDEDITVSGEYEIQRRNGEVWETISPASSAKKLAPTKAGAGECAELSFDISDLPDGAAALYRIKITVNGKAVYGGFYMGNGGEGTTLEVSSDEYPAGVSRISFEIKNTGLNTAYPEAIELYRGVERICGIDPGKIGRINSGDSETITVYCEDISGDFTAGEYRLEVSAGGREYSGSASVKDIPEERLYYFPDIVPAEKNSKGIRLTLKNNIWNEGSAIIENASSIMVQQDGIWYETVYEPEFCKVIEIPFGETADIVETDDYGDDYLEEMRRVFDELKSGEYDEFFDAEELSEIKNMSFDEYVKDVLNIAEPEKGDLCRAAIYLRERDKIEYVYFYFP